MVDLPESETPKDMTPVTIPYFLYEAMARAYYLREQNVDRPVVVPSQVKMDPDSLDGAIYMDDDLPSNWMPGGFALKDKGTKDARKTDTPDGPG